jgi:uncharacterized protein YdeI (YjbR/CyaY-like superfamily)
MAPVVPKAEHIRDFPDAAAFEKWLAASHATAPELWLKIHKKDSGLPTVSYAEALDVALCWGWIDGQKKTFDEASFLQRFCPRGRKSLWSQRNITHIERLTQAGRMQPQGQAHVDAAKVDGRWDAAYATSRDMQTPPALAAAIAANPAAQAMYATLNAQNRFALSFRIGNLKTPAGRAKKIVAFVEMLARGETIYPNGAGAKKAKGSAP